MYPAPLSLLTQPSVPDPGNAPSISSLWVALLRTGHTCVGYSSAESVTPAPSWSVAARVVIDRLQGGETYSQSLNCRYRSVGIARNTKLTRVNQHSKVPRKRAGQANPRERMPIVSQFKRCRQRLNVHTEFLHPVVVQGL